MSNFQLLLQTAPAPSNIGIEILPPPLHQISPHCIIIGSQLERRSHKSATNATSQTSTKVHLMTHSGENTPQNQNYQFIEKNCHQYYYHSECWYRFKLATCFVLTFVRDNIFGRLRWRLFANALLVQMRERPPMMAIPRKMQPICQKKCTIGQMDN